MIVSVNSETRRPTVQALKSCTKPLVMLDRLVKGVSARAVTCDHYAGVFDGPERLIFVSRVRDPGDPILRMKASDDGRSLGHAVVAAPVLAIKRNQQRYQFNSLNL